MKSVKAAASVMTAIMLMIILSPAFCTDSQADAPSYVSLTDKITLTGFANYDSDSTTVTPLILVFVVLGGLGNMWGSVVAATLLTVLPEMLRRFSDYRMLVYAIVLILVMLATNNAWIRDRLNQIKTATVSFVAGKKRKNAAGGSEKETGGEE